MRCLHTSAEIHDEGHMSQAAFGISVYVAQILRSQAGRVNGSRVLLLVGPGNNGGDALWAGGLLARRGVAVRALCVSAHCHDVGRERFIKAGGRFLSLQDISSFNPDVVIDGIFGIGLRRELSDDVRAIIETASQVGTMVAIDVPTGVNADSGLVDLGCVHADITLAVGTLKPGLLTGAGKQASGLVHVVPIDFEYPPTSAHVIDFADVQSTYGRASLMSHKYSRGVVLVHAGSAQYPGAGALTVGGARASGVGMVRFIGPAESQINVVYPDVVTSMDLARTDAIAVGSGGAGTIQDLEEYLQADIPVVIDAHALSLLQESRIPALLEERYQRGAITVVTPHEGEAKQMGFDEPHRIAQAVTIARELHSWVVLKGAGSVIASPTGHFAIDQFGTSALATAGSGDVLAGLLAGTLACMSRGKQINAGSSSAQTSDRTDVLRTIASAVALHGLAGRQCGFGCTATTLIEALVEVHSDIVDARE